MGWYLSKCQPKTYHVKGFYLIVVTYKKETLLFIPVPWETKSVLEGGTKWIATSYDIIGISADL